MWDLFCEFDVIGVTKKDKAGYVLQFDWLASITSVPQFFS